MFAVLTCIYEGHDLRLVVVAALICAIACSAAFGFHGRSLRGRDAMTWAWAGLTGLVAGSGVWATHFIAMLAYQPSLPVRYEVVGTAASLVVAVLGMGLGFALPVIARTRATALAGGALTGLSVAGLHYVGIAAIRAQAQVVWDYGYVAASIVLGVVLAAAAFEAHRRRRGRLSRLVPPVLLLLAICSLHFTAMTAVTLQPDPTLVAPTEAIGRGALAAATGGLVALILAAAGSLIWMERLGRRSMLGSLRVALDVTPAGLAFFDPAGRLFAWNRAFAELMAGCGAQAAVGARRRDFVAAAVKAGWRPADGGDPSERWSTEAEGRDAPASEARLPDGRWLRHESFRTQDGGGVTVLTDITQQKESARAMAEARDSAEAANRAKSEFLANMSHEIRTPLNGVLGVADVLMRTRLSAHQRALVGVIQKSGGHLNALLADLLDLARVEAGAVELRPERTDLAELVDSVCALFARDAAEKGLTLRAEVRPSARGEVMCDPVRLRQVLGNLVSNAVKFTDQGEVVVEAARSGEQVRFTVRDTGQGFDEALKPVLFQRFRQADNTSTRRHGGAGLGLAICDEYVRLMGGELDCSSRPGQGSAFTFALDLPALTPERAEAEAPAAAAPDAGGRFRVLVVDDNAVNRQVLQLILESVGIEHACAEDGSKAVEAMATGGFDAVLMDIQMPVMDGLEATRRIRSWEKTSRRPRAPIYVVSANCMAEHVEASRKAGADGHLAKPVSLPEIIGVLQPHVEAALAA